MEIKSLILGIFFSIGIFAIKSGLGLYYFLSEKGSSKKSLLWFLLYAGVYLSIFTFSNYLLQKLDFIQYMETWSSFFKSGMLIHILFAGLLAVWGMLLLIKKRDSKKGSLGWLAMVIPCPVCLTLIFFTQAFLLNLFPDSVTLALYSSYIGFMVIILLTVILMRWWQRRAKHSPEFLLGGAMLMIAAYFLISVMVMPQFADIDKIYRLSLYSGKAKVESVSGFFFLLGLSSALFILGFCIMKTKIRRCQNWISERF